MQLKYFQVILSSISLLIASSLFAQTPPYNRNYFKAFPDYQNVSAEYFASHPDDRQHPTYYMHFEKRYEGWFAVKKSYESTTGDEALERSKVWDASSKKYLLTRPLGPAKLGAKGDFEYYICPVYGYPEAPKDIVKMLAALPLKSLGAEELEALARAYEDIAHENFAHLQNPVLGIYDSTFNPKDIAPQVLQQAEDYAWKSIKVFKFLAKKYPKHRSIVGDAKVKLANSYLFHYLVFQGLQQPTIAHKFLKKAKYSPEMQAMAHNILESCPPNAILITQGDNDSYPLWYMQEMKDLRKDVTVLNSIQLKLGRYVYYAQNSTASPPQMTLSIDHYRANRNIYCDLVEQSENLQLFLQKVNQNRQYPPQEEYLKIPQTLYLHSQNDSIDIQLSGSYIFKNDLALLDLLASNWPQRPFCMVFQPQSNIYEALRSYFSTQGIVKVLQSSPQEGSYIYPVLDKEKTQKLFEQQFKWTKVSKDPAFHHKLKPMTSMLRYNYYELIQHHAQLDKGKAKKVYFEYRQKPIFKALSTGMLHLYFAKLTEELGLSQERDAHLQTCMDELEDALKKAEMPLVSAIDRYTPPKPMEQVHLEISQAINFCRLQDWDNWVKLFQEKFEH